MVCGPPCELAATGIAIATAAAAAAAGRYTRKDMSCRLLSVGELPLSGPIPPYYRDTDVPFVLGVSGLTQPSEPGLEPIAGSRGGQHGRDRPARLRLGDPQADHGQRAPGVHAAGAGDELAHRMAQRPAAQSPA